VKFVTALIRATGWSWRQIVKETPLSALVLILEHWESEREVSFDEAVDRAMSSGASIERAIQKGAKSKEYKRDEFLRFIQRGGIDIRDKEK